MNKSKVEEPVAAIVVRCPRANGGITLGVIAIQDAQRAEWLTDELLNPESEVIPKINSKGAKIFYEWRRRFDRTLSVELVNPSEITPQPDEWNNYFNGLLDSFIHPEDQLKAAIYGTSAQMSATVSYVVKTNAIKTDDGYLMNHTFQKDAFESEEAAIAHFKAIEKPLRRFVKKTKGLDDLFVFNTPCVAGKTNSLMVYKTKSKARFASIWLQKVITRRTKSPTENTSQRNNAYER